MSNCIHNCWIDWNSAMLCFNWLFHIGVWTFAWFVRPLFSPPYFVHGKFGPRVYNVSRIFPVSTAPILKPPDDHTFLGGLTPNGFRLRAFLNPPKSNSMHGAIQYWVHQIQHNHPLEFDGFGVVRVKEDSLRVYTMSIKVKLVRLIWLNDFWLVILVASRTPIHTHTHHTTEKVHFTKVLSNAHSLFAILGDNRRQLGCKDSIVDTLWLVVSHKHTLTSHHDSLES